MIETGRVTARNLPRPSRPCAGRTQAAFDGATLHGRGEVAQLVEHTAENRGVAGSSPALAIGWIRSVADGQAASRRQGEAGFLGAAWVLEFRTSEPASSVVWNFSGTHLGFNPAEPGRSRLLNREVGCGW